MNLNHRPPACLALVSRRLFVFAFTTVSIVQLSASPLKAQYVDWVRQLGTVGVDGFWGVSADSAGTIYAVGDTAGSLYATQQGLGDALLAKYDSSGNLLGGMQDGTSTSDRLTVAAADGTSGVFVGGTTSTGTFGPPAVGSGNNVFGHIGPSNTWTWLQQSASDSVQAGGGENTGTLLTTGAVFSAVAGPHAGGGDVLWQVRNLAGSVTLQSQFGTSGFDGGNAATVDSFGNYFIAGVTTGSLNGPNAGSSDAFVAKYDSSGNQLWVKQLGSSVIDASTSLTTDAAGNVYVAGITDGSVGGPNAGSSDNFIAKYDPSGNQLWLKQFGTSSPESNPLVTYFLGGVWLSASTYGSLFGPNFGSLDVYAARLDAGNGNVLWSTQIGTQDAENALAITTDTFLGRVYIAGITNGSFGGPHVGSDDAMLIAINAVPPVPEPASVVLLGCGAAVLAFRTRRKCGPVISAQTS